MSRTIKAKYKPYKSYLWMWRSDLIRHRTAFGLSDSQHPVWKKVPRVPCLRWELSGWPPSWAAGLLRPKGSSRSMSTPDKFEKKPKCSKPLAVSTPKYQSRPIQEVLLEVTDGGLDYALECVGSPDVMEGVLFRNAERSSRSSRNPLVCAVSLWSSRSTLAS